MNAHTCKMHFIIKPYQYCLYTYTYIISDKNAKFIASNIQL